MRLISRHILRTLIAPFSWGVLALTGMLLLNSLPPLIERFGGKGIEFRTMAEGVVVITPALLSLTMPMAVLVSVLYGYSQLAANLEMVAMYANGISVWRMARPALLGAAVVALANFVVFDQLMPRSNVRYLTLIDAVGRKWPTLALRQQVLNILPARTGYILRADAIEQETGNMRRVTIFDLTENMEQVRRLIIADSGNMAESANGRDLVLMLHSGTIYEFKPNEPGRLQQIDFVHNRIVVRDVQNSLDLSRTGRGGFRSEKELSGCEILNQLDSARWTVTNSRNESEYYTRSDLRTLAGLPPVARPAVTSKPTFPEHCGTLRRFGARIMSLVKPKKLAAQGPPQNPPQNPAQTPPQNPAPPGTQQAGVPQATPVQTPGVVQPAPQGFLVPPQGVQVGGALTPPWNVINAQVVTNSSALAVYRDEVEFHQKFAVPLSCFCFVLIGMALALKYPAGGIGLVIGGSLVIFLGFYILLQGGRGVALTGQLDPVIAMYAPLLLFTIIGIVAVNSANREMGTARTGGMLDALLSVLRGRND